jgi:hypothetical protein
MTTEWLVLFAIGAILGILVVRRAIRNVRRQRQGDPISQQWLLDQRVREEQ